MILWHINQFRLLIPKRVGARVATHQGITPHHDAHAKGICVHCLTYEASGRAPMSYSPCDRNHNREY